MSTRRICFMHQFPYISLILKAVVWGKIRLILKLFGILHSLEKMRWREFRFPQNISSGTMHLIHFAQAVLNNVMHDPNVQIRNLFSDETAGRDH